MQNENRKPIDRLTVFSFLWACQALVHQEFYNGWVDNQNISGWLVTVVALVLLFRPSSVFWLAALAVTSILYNVGKWPFVVNHILLESLINFVVLCALATLWPSQGQSAGSMLQRRDEMFDRFAPVLRVGLVIMYYFAVIAKLNTGFFDPQQSCVVTMFGDLVRRVPFLPENEFTHGSAIWGTVVIELAIPLLLTLKRTQWIAVLLGLSFHFMLGMIGHRTFSGLAYALYSLFLIDALAPTVQDIRERVVTSLGERAYRKWLRIFTAIIILSFAILIAADVTGNYRTGLGPLKFFRVPWVIWIGWSVVVASIYAAVIWTSFRISPKRPLYKSCLSRPGWLWMLLIPVAFNGMNQYLGFKTETCFTMYSNLRTEGGVNNHFFMPAWKLAGYQNDLVEVLSTDHPDLKKYVDEDFYLTYFEFRRIVSNSQEDFSVSYRRGSNEILKFKLAGGEPSDRELARRHPLMFAKLLLFRPVPKSDESPCQH